MAVFSGRPYPGGWDGMDAHGYERELVKMEYRDVPVQVREWIENQEEAEGPGKGLFGVFAKPGTGETASASVEDKIVIFAPGALYETLPLWLVQDSGCEGMSCLTWRFCALVLICLAGTLMDISKYSPKMVDGGIVGWPTEHTIPAREHGQRQISFTLKAQVLSSGTKVPASNGQERVQTDAKDEL